MLRWFSSQCLPSLQAFTGAEAGFGFLPAHAGPGGLRWRCHCCVSALCESFPTSASHRGLPGTQESESARCGFFSGNRDKEIQHPCLQATGDISGGGGGVEVLGMQLVEGLG